MTETTIADRLAEVLKMLRSDWSPGGMERRDDGDWVDYNAMCPAVLTLIHTLLREERERCADAVAGWIPSIDGTGGNDAAHRIRNLGDRT